MNELLTTKQVLELLKIDRTTVYRMLKDRRLIGVKVGNQWRFRRDKVDELIAGGSTVENTGRLKAADVLPVHCLQPIQDVFAEIAGTGALTTESNGEPMTEISNCREFCGLILASGKGRSQCIDSWRRLTTLRQDKPDFFTCHAGLQYLGAPIEVDGHFTAMLFAGQIYIEQPDPDEEKRRIETIAGRYGIDERRLLTAARSVNVLNGQHRRQLGVWLRKIATTYERIGGERKRFLSRLQQISDLTGV